MKNKASLTLIELTVMLLVFALAAALCLRFFTWAETNSLEDGRKDQAYLQLQTAAEVLKHCRGDFEAAARRCGGSWDGEQWIIALDETLMETEETPAFVFRSVPEITETDYLGAALLQITKADGAQLASLRICWQEVTP